MNKTNLVLKMSLAALMAGSVGTATADVIDGTASAVVITPLTVTETTALDYGSIAGGSTAGSVTMSSAGTISAAGGATFVSASASNQATFDITGELNTAITVTLTTAGAQLDDGAGGGAVMALGTFSNTALPTTTDGAGAATFDVGATLSVGANQAAGSYTTALGAGAPYTVTVNYQ